ncbi:MAG: ATP citrate lyase citrate-binding domain-containing protein [Candidatus Woesearchaeota archaeon]|nr:ATP citrate lyase citrate-binding domain-containing protein [Candidatus Woesearchaeota archaeon]
MKLPEHKGKELLKIAGIKSPPHILTNNKSYINLSFHKERYKEFFMDHQHVIIKAQVIASSRKKSGLIVESSNFEESLKLIDGLYKKTANNVLVDTLLIEKKLDVSEEYFLAILYDTDSRSPVILFSKAGGVDVEELITKGNLIRVPFSALHGLSDYQARDIAKQAGFTGATLLQLALFIKKAYDCFERHDCTSLEINPIIKTSSGQLFAGDAKIVIDDNAVARHELFSDVTDFEDKSVLSEREREARKIDYHDHRGVAGKTFIEMGGDIAVLASGGGASLTAMDALIQAGGNPANYTEYSGNPPREKVRRLAEITLAKPGLNGCLVIGGKANFTDIFETLGGFAEVLEQLKPKYPIVIRRAGQRDKEAFAHLRTIADCHQLDITLFGDETPMATAARIAAQKINEYKQRR